jgi:hypothetical protein
MSEHSHQCALFSWARNPATLKKYPALDLLEGSANGVKMSITQTVIEAHEARKWQPIETAPRDGSGFIGWSPTHGIVWNVSWNHSCARFDKNGHDSRMSDYTLWQHLPKPKPPKEL